MDISGQRRELLSSSVAILPASASHGFPSAYLPRTASHSAIRRPQRLPQNRVSVFGHCDRSRLPIAKVTWDPGEQVRQSILTSSPRMARELEVAGIDEVYLEQFMQAGVRNGIKYFGHARSTAVYGSPTKQLLTESYPLKYLHLPLEQQYFEGGAMLEYPRSEGERKDVLSKYAQHMHVGVNRVALAQRPRHLEQSHAWGRAKRIVGMYRNGYYISTHNVAKTLVHLLQTSLARTQRDRAWLHEVTEHNVFGRRLFVMAIAYR